MQVQPLQHVVKVLVTMHISNITWRKMKATLDNAKILPKQERSTKEKLTHHPIKSLGSLLALSIPISSSDVKA